MNILAVIPARGGSKSVPRKNIRPLLGRPLIAWAINAAAQATLVSRSIVSTDDEEIADVACRLGADVPFLRPAAISHDLATDVEFLAHALDWLRDNERYEPDIVVRVPPTSPLNTGTQIDRGIRTLLDTPGADAVRPIMEVTKHPYKMWRISANGQWLEPFLPSEITGIEAANDLPRQVFPKAYIHTGAMDVMWTRTIRAYGSKAGRHLAYFFMRPEDALNIDDEIDFALAEFFLSRRLGREGTGEGAHG